MINPAGSGSERGKNGEIPESTLRSMPSGFLASLPEGIREGTDNSKARNRAAPLLRPTDGRRAESQTIKTRTATQKSSRPFRKKGASSNLSSPGFVISMFAFVRDVSR
jgi:hypothetical protein